VASAGSGPHVSRSIGRCPGSVYYPSLNLGADLAPQNRHYLEHYDQGTDTSGGKDSRGPQSRRRLCRRTACVPTDQPPLRATTSRRKARQLLMAARQWVVAYYEDASTVEGWREQA
jgi:hypothetical protein